MMDFSEETLRRFAEGAAEERTFTIGPTTFTVNKIPPLKAYEVWNEFRPGIVDALAKVRTDLPTKTQIAMVVGAIPPEIERKTRASLFEHTEFVRQSVNDKPLNLLQEGDMAFADLEPLDVGKVFVRALLRNFSASLLDLMSLTGEEIRDSSQ